MVRIDGGPEIEKDSALFNIAPKPQAKQLAMSWKAWRYSLSQNSCTFDTPFLDQSYRNQVQIQS